MTTKIFVSQIDFTRPDGSTAANNSALVITETGNTDWIPISSISSNGYRGSAGAQGENGYFGSTGYTGSKGEDGALGLAGFKGSSGDTGYFGSTGYSGSAGFFGSIGYRGTVGYSGSNGLAGYQGSAGLAGQNGYNGSTGFQGSAGIAGYTGSAGPSGAAGTLVGLTDVANTYSGSANKVLVINAAATGVVFSSNLNLNDINTTTANVGTLKVSTISSNVSFSGNPSFSGTSFNFGGNILANTNFKGYSEFINDAGTSGSTEVWNPLNGNVIKSTLDNPVVTVTLDGTGLDENKLYSMTVFIKQDSTGGRVIDWTNNLLYWSTAEGINQTTGPTLSVQPYYTDIITFYTYDAGGTWYGSLGAKGFPTA
jgi:hypothetical protein